ncbi:MAG: NRDE family protein [Marinomonas foliarum]|uniref:NRDE family protein n=1 Tax=Marinomonas foliarum TaxID=491950 RepID=UPI003F9B19B5
MCSVSWWIDESGYQLFFNRDEQKTRAPALSPQSFTLQGIQVLMPIDPVGKGSWISLNEAGVSLCLLNNYQGKTPSGQLTSRGQLVKQLSSATGLAQIEWQFAQLDLQQFAPFTLLAFELGNSKVREFQWDGENASILYAQSPHFSSAVELEGVTAYRQSVYEELAVESADDLLLFHSQHHPEQSHFSVCMHREDAQTVSFTRIQVAKDNFQMSYVAGSPCSNLTPQALASQSYCFQDNGFQSNRSQDTCFHEKVSLVSGSY